MRSETAVPIGLLCSLALFGPSRALATQDIFLAIAGLDRESTDQQFAGSIEALSVTGGVTTETAATAGGAGAGRPTFAPIVVKPRRTTAASPGLLDAVASGKRFPQAVVSFRRAGERPFVFLTYTLSDAGVSSFQSDGNVTQDAPSESVSLTYSRIKIDYFRQNPDGTQAPAVSTCWDVVANARCQ